MAVRRQGKSDKKKTRGRGQVNRKPQAKKKKKVDFPQQCEDETSALSNPSGRSRKYHEHLMFMHAVFKLVKLHADGSLARLAKGAVAEAEGEMIKYVHFVGKLVSMAQATRTEVWTEYKMERCIAVNETPRGRAVASSVVLDARQLKPDHLAEIETFIAECHGPRGGGRVTLQSIQGHLLRTFSKTSERMRTRENEKLVLSEVKLSVIRYALVTFLGYAWGKIRLRKIQGDPKRPDIMRTYLKAYADALKKEREGTHVIVYTDESYLHQNHAPTESWLKADGDRHVDRSSSKGKRLIILHAISKFGPIGGEDKSMKWAGDTPHVNHDNAACAETSELLWVSNSSTGDYHDNMNGTMFLKWVKDKLTRAFKKFCLDKFNEQKKMILVLDVSVTLINRLCSLVLC